VSTFLVLTTPNSSDPPHRDAVPPTRALASAGAVTSAPVPSADDLDGSEDAEDKQNGDAMQL
jgi:hypothetical protein